MLYPFCQMLQYQRKSESHALASQNDYKNLSHFFDLHIKKEQTIIEIN